MMGIVHKVEKQIKSALNFQNRMFNDASKKVRDNFFENLSQTGGKIVQEETKLNNHFFSMHLTDFRIVKILVEK